MTTLFADKTVLVIDKHLEDLKMLTHVLNQLGFASVQVASSVNMALLLLREKPVDVCFINHDLGSDEKNGLQLLYELRAEHNYRFGTAYILVVDKDRSSLLLGSPANAPDTYVSKPYNRAQIAQRLETVLRVKLALAAFNKALDAERWQHAIDQSRVDEKRFPGLSVYLRRQRAILYLNHDEPLSALAIFRGLLKEQTRPWIRIGLAIAAERCGEFELAQKELTVVLDEQQQQCIEAFHCRSHLAAIHGNYRDAMQLLQKALKLQPTVGALHVEVAQMAALLDDPRSASQALMQTIRFNRLTALQAPEDYFGLVRLLQQQLGDSTDTTNPLHTECLRVLEDVVRDFPDRPEVVFQVQLAMGRRWRRIRDVGRAESTDLMALELFQALPVEQQAQSLDLLVDELSETSLAETVTKLRSQVMRESLKLGWAKLNLQGTSAFRDGNAAEAREAFLNALAEQPKSVQLILNYVQATLACLNDKPEQRSVRLAECARRLMKLRYPALTQRQQERYRTLLTRLTTQVEGGSADARTEQGVTVDG